MRLSFWYCITFKHWYFQLHVMDCGLCSYVLCSKCYWKTSTFVVTFLINIYLSVTVSQSVCLSIYLSVKREPQTSVIILLLLPLLSARPAVTFPAAEHHRPFASTKLYCLVTEAHRCEQLAQDCYAAFAPSRMFEPTTCWWQVQRSTRYATAFVASNQS